MKSAPKTTRKPKESGSESKPERKTKSDSTPAFERPSGRSERSEKPERKTTRKPYESKATGDSPERKTRSYTKKSDSDRPYQKTSGRIGSDRPDSDRKTEGRPTRKPYEGKSERSGDRPTGRFGSDRPDSRSSEGRPARKPYEGKSERSGDRPAGRFGSDRPDSRGSEGRPERKPYEGRSERSGDRPAGRFGSDRPDSRGSEGRPERKPYERKSEGSGDRPAGRYGSDRPDSRSNEGRPERKPYERKSEGSGDRPAGRYGSDRPDSRSSEGRPERKPYERKSEGSGDRPAGRYGSDRPKPEGDGGYKKRDYDSKPPRNYDDDKPRSFREPETDVLGKPLGKYESNRKRKDDEYFSKKNSYVKRPRKVLTEEEIAAKYKPQPAKGQPKFIKAEKEDEITEGSIRLNRYIANSGVCSRREADELIAAGVVTVNGNVVTEMGYKVKADDKVQYAGETLRREKKIYLLLNKPKDYITTTDDPSERKTVMDLLKGACKERIYPVGRLDRATTGLLLFTNDGEMAKKLTHPSHGAQKLYHVFLDKGFKSSDMEKVMDGLTLEDGFIKVDEIVYAGEAGDKKEIGFKIHSGKNRIVRRLFAHLGYEVVKLDRVVFAGLTKKDLPRGHWRMLTEKELNILKMVV